MSILPDLRERNLLGEAMDDPDLGSDEHVAALRGLARLNRLSCTTSTMWKPIRELSQRYSDTPLRILEIATGSGDLPVQLQLCAARAQITLDITATDISDRALDVARERATRAAVDVTFETRDVLGAEIPGEFDVVMCSLFLHHLQTEDASRLLVKMANAARRCVLVNDLRRSRSSYILAHVACRLFTRSPVVHVDGPLSVQAAFTIPEMRRMANEAGMRGATINAKWPARFILQWLK